MKKIIKYIFLFNILISDSSTIFANEIHFKQETKNLNLTMQQAVEMAYKYRPSLQAYKYATQASKQDAKIAMAGYWPQVNLKEIPYYQKGMQGFRNQITFEASQLVYSFAGPLEQKRIAQRGAEATKYSEETQKDLIQYEVEVAFLQSWLLQRKNLFIKSLESSSSENITKAEHQNKLELLNKNDWLNDAATYSENMSTVYYYPDELYNAKNQLEYYIGKPFKSDEESITLVWNSNKEIGLKSLNFYYEKALQNRKEIKQKQKEAEQQHEYKNYYTKIYLPTLNLKGAAGRFSGGALGDVKNNSIGLALNWNISDGGANFHESNKANANKLKAMMEKENYIQQAKFEVQKAYYDLSTLLKQLVAQDIRLTQAENEFTLNKLKFDIGEISKVELETSKYNWETQKFNWLTVKVNCAVKERELYYACGYPKDFD